MEESLQRHTSKTQKEENEDIGLFDFSHLPRMGWKTHIEIVSRLKKQLAES
jgi:hypothetical protein